MQSFARIHRANLINAGILPLTFKNEADYEKIDQDDVLLLKDIRKTIENDGEIVLENVTKGIQIPVSCDLSGRSKDIILAGGLLNYTKQQLG